MDKSPRESQQRTSGLDLGSYAFDAKKDVKNKEKEQDVKKKVKVKPPKQDKETKDKLKNLKKELNADLQRVLGELERI